MAKDLAALEVYKTGKPLVIEEIFPLGAGVGETAEFIEAAREDVNGWISFYWGKKADEYTAEEGIKGALIGEWLRYFRKEAPKDGGWGAAP